MPDDDRAFRQARKDAKELLAGLTEGDPGSLSRVLVFHPKFAGRPAQRAQGYIFRLPDAQATIAVERGYDSWLTLSLALNQRETWHSGFSDIEQRAFTAAQAVRSRYLLPEHFVLALLSPKASTPALETLTELGLSREDISNRVTGGRRSRGRALGARSSHPSARLMGFANGIAVGLGAAIVNDQHVLQALAFDRVLQSHLERFGIDPSEVMDQLASRGVSIPAVEPPPLEAPFGPFGPWVYVPRERLGEATERLGALFPPGTIRWGTNKSKWKRDYWYVHGEDSIPMEQLVREVIIEPEQVEVLSFEEGLRVEKEGAKRRYRDRP